MGTTLIWAVAVNSSAAAALGGTPAGWTLLVSQVVGTLALGIYQWKGNPGAITTVTFSSNATATTGGIASWFWEIDNTFFSTSTTNSATGSSTALASGSLTPPNDVCLLLGIAAWVLGTATFSSTSTNGSGIAWTFNSQQSSTAGTTNAALQTGTSFGAYGAVAAAQAQGTLSVSSVWDAVIVAIPSTAGGQAFLSGTRSFVVDSGGVGTGDLGSGGWASPQTVKPGGDGRY